MTPPDPPVTPHLTVLGGFQLDAGESLPVGRAGQRLLAYLAVRGGWVRRAILRTELWPDSDDAHSASSLRSSLWRLPRPGGPALVVAKGDHLALADHVQVDLWRATEQAQHFAGSPDEIGAALARSNYPCFAADLLPDWSESWLMVEQESYRQLRLHALERASTVLRSTGAYHDALLSALLAVRGEPLRESGHRHVIAAHLAEGNPGEALRQFHVCRRVLAAELGLAPSGETRALVGHLLGRPMER
jgi:DNA-binding SARP family transcriptional activator